MRRLVALTTSMLVLALSVGPAHAARSPRPTARLIGTGTIVTGEGEESYLEVEGRDPDGIVTEVTVFWGDRSISFAHSYPCLIPPTPAPGTPHRMLLSHLYEEPGTYTVRYVVSSISGCTGDIVEQHSRPYVVRLAAE